MYSNWKIHHLRTREKISYIGMLSIIAQVFISWNKWFNPLIKLCVLKNTLCLLPLSHAFSHWFYWECLEYCCTETARCKTPCGKSVLMFTNWKKLCSTEGITKGLKKCVINTSQSLEKIWKIARKWCVSLAPALLETLSLLPVSYTCIPLINSQLFDINISGRSRDT